MLKIQIDQKKYGDKIKRLIADNGLTNQVFLTGKVSEEGKQFFMKNCTAFLFPSIREGFGLPPIEAMSFGKPTFLSNKTSLPEIGGEASIYWDNFDPEYMKDILFNGLNNFDNNKTEIENLFFPGRKQFLAGKLWAGVQIKGRWRPIGGKLGRCKTMQMGLVAWRDLQLPSLDFTEPLRLKPSTHGLFDTGLTDSVYPETRKTCD